MAVIPASFLLEYAFPELSGQTFTRFRVGAISISLFIGLARATVWLFDRINDYRPPSKTDIRKGIKKTYLSIPEDFIDRIDATRELYSKVQHCGLLNLHGPKGAGKTKLLQVIVDIINGHHHDFFEKHLDLRLKKRSDFHAIYVDAGNGIGISAILDQLGKVVGLDNCDNINDFCIRCDQTWGNESLAIVIDNLNNRELHADLVGVLNTLQRQRPKDTVVLGTVLKFAQDVGTIDWISIKNFQNDDAEEYCRTICGLEDPTVIKEVVASGQGLPVYMAAYAKAYKRDSSILTKGYDFRSLVNNEILPNLSSDAKHYFLTAVAISLIEPMVCTTDLYLSRRNEALASIHELDQFGVIIRLHHDKDAIKVPDLIRDTLVSVARDDVSGEAQRLAEYYRASGKRMHFVLMSLLGGTDHWPEAIEILKEQADQSNNIFIERCWEVFAPSHHVNNLADVYRWLHLSHVRALLSQGDYGHAEKEADKLVEGFVSTVRAVDEFTVLLRYTRADIDHLLNRYEHAQTQSLALLDDIASEPTGFSARCLWLAGHAQAHMGSDFSSAFALLQQAKKAAQEYGDLKTTILSINGIAAIDLMRGMPPERIESDILDGIQLVGDRTDHVAEKAALCRTLSRVCLRMGKPEAASMHAEQALAITLEMGNRSVHDSRHCVADVARYCGNWDEAMPLYRKVLDAAERSDDINLKTTARMAATIIDIASGPKPIFHGTWSKCEENLLDIMQVSKDLGIRVNELRADMLRQFLPTTTEASRRTHLPRISYALNEIGLRPDVQLIAQKNPEGLIQLMDIQAL